MTEYSPFLCVLRAENNVPRTNISVPRAEISVLYAVSKREISVPRAVVKEV